MSETPIYNDRNAYIVGAGFSKEFGLPVVSEFLNRIRDNREWLRQQSRTAELDAIDHLFKFRLEASSAAERIRVDLENIEELFSLAAASEGERLADQVILATAATLDYSEKVSGRPTLDIAIFKPGWQTPSTWKLTSAPGAGGRVGYSCPLMEGFMLNLFGLPEDRAEERRDTLITLNYDLLPEDALYSLRIPFTYGIPEEDAIFDSTARCSRPPIDEKAIQVLKLHGSVNWTSENEKAVVHGTYEDVRKKGKVPLLVPPTWRKPMGGSLLAVWDAAVAALRTARNVVIIGYSMPRTDQHFKYLLAAGLKGNISLRQILFVNPVAARLAKSLFKCFGPIWNPKLSRLLLSMLACSY